MAQRVSCRIYQVDKLECLDSVAMEMIVIVNNETNSQVQGLNARKRASLNVQVNEGATLIK